MGTHVKETYPRDLEEYMKQFHKGVLDKNIYMYRKGGTRRRAYTGREAAEA